jgi:hypothetical protein
MPVSRFTLRVTKPNDETAPNHNQSIAARLA